MNTTPNITEQTMQAIVKAGPQLINKKYVQVAAFTAFTYDLIITIPDEVKYIWNRKFNFVSFLYFMNRYYAFSALAVSVMQLTLPAFTAEFRCQRSFLFPPLSTGIVLIFCADIAIGVRVFALYNLNKRLGAFMILYLSVELGVALWIYLLPGHHPTVLPGPPDAFNTLALHSCGFSVSPTLSNLQAAAYQLMQTGYDSTMFVLILFKTFSEAFQRRSGSTLSLRYCIARDGLIYYLIVFSCNIIWALMTIFAPSQIKMIAAEPTIHLSCIAVNRLAINLRAFGTDLLEGTTKQGTQTSIDNKHQHIHTLVRAYGYRGDMNDILLEELQKGSATTADDYSVI